MTENNPASPTPVPPARLLAKRLRIIGAGILLLGGGIAGLIYWLGNRTTNLTDDLEMQGYSRTEQRQMEQLFGSMGGLIEDWSTALKQPGNQAMLIIVTSLIIAAGCYYFAHRLANNEAVNNQNDSPP